MAAEEASTEPLKYRTWVLKVPIHCQGCKRKVKKVLQGIEGVYTVTFDAQKHKVSVIGDVDSDTLIKKLIKTGKHAELWPEDQSEKKKSKSKKKKKKKKNNSNNKEQKDPKSSEEDSSDDEHEDNEDDNDAENKQKSSPNGENGNDPTTNETQGKITVTVTENPQNGGGPPGGGKGGKKKKKKGHKGNNNITFEGVETSVDATGTTGSNALAPAVGPVNLSHPPQLHHVYPYPSYGVPPPPHHYITPTNYAVSCGYNTVHHIPSTSYAARYPQPFTYAYVEPETYELPSDPLEVYSDEEELIGCLIM